MKYFKTPEASSQQSGFTLVEMLVSIAIMGILAAVIGQAISQLFLINASGNARMTAIKQMENSINYMRQDMLMAQIVIPEPDTESFLKFIWVEWVDYKKNQIIYSVNDKQLQRQVVVTDKDGNEVQYSTQILARDIGSVTMDNKTGYAGGKIIITIIIDVRNMRPAIESRTFEVLPRPAN